MFDIPISINVNGQSYNIRKKGDFRMVLDCFVALNDMELSKEERRIAALMIFYEDFNEVEDVLNCDDETLITLIKEMYKFFNCGQEDGVGHKLNHNLVDWKKDEQFICSAVNNVAKKEIRLEEYLHWWTFMGYYLAIGDSPMSTIIAIRHKIVEGKKLEKYEQEFKKDNPQYFDWNFKSVEEREAEQEVLAMWNS